MSKVPWVEYQVLHENRDTDFCVYVLGRKEIMILYYPLQIEISLYMSEVQISVYLEERKDRDLLLQIKISGHMLALIY